MKRLILFATAALALPGAAFATEPAAPAEPKCCCEKMRDGKGCCPEKDKTGHDEHGDHEMDSPKP